MKSWLLNAVYFSQFEYCNPKNIAFFPLFAELDQNKTISFVGIYIVLIMLIRKNA